VAVTSAWAQPPVSQSKGMEQSPSELIQVQDRRRGGGDDMRRDNDRRRFAPGRRYDEAPRGWRRHGHRRPHGWRTRGCILVGPFWFCP
jgi:hypothetical protein